MRCRLCCGIELIQAILGLRVHVSVRQSSLYRLFTRMRSVCWVSLLRGNPTLTSSDGWLWAPFYQYGFKVFSFPLLPKNVLTSTKYSPVDESCPDEGEQAWPTAVRLVEGGRCSHYGWDSHSALTSLFVCPCSRQMICISCRMGSRQEAVTGVGGSLPGRGASGGHGQAYWDGPPTSLALWWFLMLKR